MIFLMILRLKSVQLSYRGEYRDIVSMTPKFGMKYHWLFNDMAILSGTRLIVMRSQPNIWGILYLLLLILVLLLLLELL